MTSDGLAKWERAGAAAALVIVLSFPAYLLRQMSAADGMADRVEANASYVGSERCGKCHKNAYEKWRHSHHDLAMDTATEETVLADFDEARFEHHGTVTRFFRKNGRFFVRTMGPDGMADFEILHTFGAYPLQQYLVALSGGRLQALDIAWDVREKRWYHLFPDEHREPGDWLHWTGAGLNWNGMCAECHSTHLVKGLDPETGDYRTSYQEIHVGCEACHGPGSLHAAWAEQPEMARPDVINYNLEVNTGSMSAGQQVVLCARCHGRRMLLGDYRDGEGDLLDKLVPELLLENLYFPDGQILDEVFEYASYVQSKMYGKGIRCGDCHDVHGTRRLKDGNELCLQCHRADTYDTKDHHFHKKVHEGKPSEGALCEKCHMPGRIYMGVDYRLDHSIRIPRPDLSISLGVPNACNQPGCHADKSNEWSDEHYTKWYGLSRKPHYGSVIASGRRGDPMAREGLITLAADLMSPFVARATAIHLLGGYPDEDAKEAIRKGSHDDEPLVRQTALTSLQHFDQEGRMKLILPLLEDPVKAVRIHAAFALTSVSPEALRGALTERDRRAFGGALREFQAAMEYAGDFATARYNLGNMHFNLGRGAEAEEQYRRALKIDRHFTPAKVNLAMLCNQNGRNIEAERLLRESLEQEPQSHDVAYMLGLLLSETKRYEEAAAFLERAATGMPGQAQVYYNWGLLLAYLQKEEKAEAAFLHAEDLEPENPTFLYALAEFYLKQGQPGRAREFAERLLAVDPSNKETSKLLQRIIGLPRKEGR